MATIDTSKLNSAITSKYTVENNTFVAVPKDVATDRIKVEVGDIKQTDFLPQVKIQRWDNEVNASFRLVHDETTPTVSTATDKIVWDGDKVACNFYNLPADAQNEDGAYEFEVILKEKPKTNVVSFTINTKGLDFYYQHIPTQEELEDTTRRRITRDEKIWGSYAVYASEQKINYVGGKEYKAGKVGQIYRPQIVDADGNKVWGELKVDTENGILSVTIPQDFLDKAVYPVKHAAGLTFGYTTIGTFAGYGLSPDEVIACLFTSPNPISTITSITAYVAGWSSGSHYKGLVLLHSTKAIVSNGITAATNISSNGVIAWVTSTFSTPPSVSASTEYLLGAISDSDQFDFVTDESGTTQFHFDNTNSYATPATLGATSDYNEVISIYATYTAGGGGTTANPHHLSSTGVGS